MGRVSCSPFAARILAWFDAHRRDLPWREPGTSPWAILVCEVMSQQTPVARVIPRWREFMTAWPTPADLAAASPASVLRAWDRLGYPRRALNLQRAAAAVVERHGGQLPASEEDLLALPGVGPYTAAAVAAFAFGQRTVVLDTNVRRVLARQRGAADAGTGIKKAELDAAWEQLPAGAADACAYNEGVMELGALVCKRRAPACAACPVAGTCGWRAAGYPKDAAAAPRTQAYAGTDRQARGKVLAALRAHPDLHWLPRVEALAAASADRDQAVRALDSLLADGLLDERADRAVALPAGKLPT